MSLDDITKKEKKIVETLATKGLKTYYELYAEKKENIGSSSTVWKGLKKLEDLNLIKLRKEEEPHGKESWRGRKRKHYGLTFKGILYALNLGFITPEEGYETRIRNKASIPVINPQLAKKIASDARAHKVFAKRVNKDIIDFATRIEKENARHIYSFLVKHTNLSFYSEIETAQMMLVAELQITPRVLQIMKSYKSLRTVEKAVAPMLYTILEKIVRNNSKKWPFKKKPMRTK